MHSPTIPLFHLIHVICLRHQATVLSFCTIPSTQGRTEGRTTQYGTLFYYGWRWRWMRERTNDPIETRTSLSVSYFVPKREKKKSCCDIEQNIIRTCTFEYSAKDIARRKDVLSWLACTHSLCQPALCRKWSSSSSSDRPSFESTIIVISNTNREEALKRILLIPIPNPIFIPYKKTQRQSEDEWYC